MIEHLREDVGKVGDPRAQALFETAAEVLGEPVKAYEHFDTATEEAGRN